MAEFLEAPEEALQAILEEIGAQGARRRRRPPRRAGARRGRGRRCPPPPRLVDLAGFSRFLQDLKNRGMHPYLMGDFPMDPGPAAAAPPPRPAAAAGGAAAGSAARDGGDAAGRRGGRRPPRRPYLVR